MKIFFSWMLLSMLATAQLFAQQGTFKVQGFPREDIAVQAQPQQAQRQKSPLMRAATDNVATFDDITFWVGEGSNRCALAVQWNTNASETNAMVWGYQWDGTQYGVDLVYAVAKADPRFCVLSEATTSGYGTAVSGIGYDANDDGVFWIRNKTTGETIYPNEDGVLLGASGYNYDDFEGGDPEDYWGAGWYQSYWSYWLKDNDNDSWGYSGLGASSKLLTNGCWDGWNFALGMSSRPWKPLVAAPAPGYTAGTFFLNVDKQNFSSSISLLDKKNVFTYDIYGEANSGERLPLNTRYAAIFGDKIYFVAGNTTNTSGSIVVASALKLEKIAQINNVNGHQLLGISQALAYVSTENGIYQLDLQNNTLGSLIAGTDNLGKTALMVKSGKHVLAVLQSGGIKVVDTQTSAVSKTIDGSYLSIAQSSDGNIWAISNDKLAKINPQTFDVTEVTLPAHCKIAASWEDWNANSFFADVKSNALYWANTGANGTTVYKYQIGNEASLDYPFFSLPSGFAFEGAGVRLNQIANELHISATNTTTGKKQVYVVAASNGDLLASIAPTTDYSNAALIFYPDNAPSISNVKSDYTVALNSASFNVPLAGAATDKDNIDKNVELSVQSENPELVSASLSGDVLTITPQAGESGIGKVTLSALSNGKQTNKNLSVTITRALESIAFPYATKTLKRGSNDTLNVTFTPANATNQKLTWSRTSGTAVGVYNGIVTAYNVGTATVKAVSSEGEFVAECVYTVEDVPLSGIAFSKDTANLFVGQKDTLMVAFSPVDAYSKGIVWTRTPSDIASTSWNVSGGMLTITGSKEGTMILSAKSSDGGFVDTCIVNVSFNHATKLSLDKHELNLTAPHSESLKGTFFPANASNKTITWSSSDAAVATVSSYGTVKGIVAGTALIIATSTDNPELKDTATVTVDYVPLTGFEIAKDSTIGVNEYLSVTSTFTPSNASSKTITWTTSDAAIATVSNYGSVKGIAAGTATIYATTNGTFKDSVKITVVNYPVEGISFDEKEVYIKISQYKMLYYTFTPAAPTNTKFTFASLNPDIVKVNSATSAYAIGVAYGTTKMCITTTDGSFSDTCIVHCIADVDELSLSSAVESMIVGDKLTLTAVATPDNAIQAVTWTSSNPKVAGVDENGVVTALTAGATNIIAVSADEYAYGLKEDTCVVTVSNQISGSIQLSETNKQLWLNESFRLSHSFLPDNTTNKRVMYKSSDYSVAFVNSEGQVTATGIGTADITVVAQDGGANAVCTVTVANPNYTAGAFFVNEDWFGHNNSTVNFLDDEGSWHYRVYQNANPGKELGCTSQFGTIYGDKFFIVSKQEKDPGATVTGSRLAVCNAQTMESLAEFTTIGGADGRSFLGVDEHKGYIGTSNGIYVFNMDNLSIGAKVTGTENETGSLYTGQIGTMVRVGDKVFAVNQQKGLMVIDVESDKVQTVINAPLDGTKQRGFGSIVQSKDGSLWLSIATDISGSGGGEEYMLKLNPYTLDTARVALPAGASIPNSWYAWTADGFCASTQNNKLYWKNNGGWFDATKIYEYDIDNESVKELVDFSAYEPSEKWGIYGAGFRLDPVTDDIYVSLYKAFANPTYKVAKVSTADGTVTDAYPMEDSYWFPAMPVFPDNEAPVAVDWSAINVAEDTVIYLGDKVSDADNMQAAIVKSLQLAANESLISAHIADDSLYIVSSNTSIEPQSTSLTVKFNSNGKLAEKIIQINVAGRPVVNVASVDLNEQAVSIEKDKIYQLIATVLPDNASNKNVTWSSSDTAIAAVSENGLVTAVAAGTATITVTTEEGGLTASCTVTVTGVATGVEQSEASKNKVYPTVTTGLVYIVIQDRATETAQLVNMSGEVLQVIRLQSPEMTIDLSPYQAGIYFIRLGNQTAKIVKQ